MSEPVSFLDGRVQRDRTPRPVTIYALCEMETGERRYVGKTTKRPGRRLTEHCWAAKTSHLPVGRWIRKQTKNGRHPTIEVLELVPAGGDWEAREAAWIATLPRQRRLNITDGGEGLPGLHMAGTDHARRISESLRRGRSFSCEHCGAEFWRKPNEIASGDCRFCSRECYHASQKGISKPVSELFAKRGIAAAAHARRSQTHCKRGHPLSGENLYVNRKGLRVCKACRKLHKLAFRRLHEQS